jgi:hypothetical protein
MSAARTVKAARVPKSANQDCINKRPGKPVTEWDHVLKWLRANGKRTTRMVGWGDTARARKSSLAESAFDFCAHLRVQEMCFDDWRGHEMAEWAFDIFRDGAPKMTAQAMDDWFTEKLEEWDDSDGPLDYRDELEEYFT